MVFTLGPTGSFGYCSAAPAQVIDRLTNDHTICSSDGLGWLGDSSVGRVLESDVADHPEKKRSGT